MRFLASTRSLAGTSLLRSGSCLLDKASPELKLLSKVSFMTCVQRCRIQTLSLSLRLLFAGYSMVEAMLQSECWIVVYVSL